jgi:hypothetical protein
MNTVFQSADAASAAPRIDAPSAEQFSLQQILALALSGKGLRLGLIAAAVFMAWKAFQGLRSLFWAAFGIAWVLFWTSGGPWF